MGPFQHPSRSVAKHFWKELLLISLTSQHSTRDGELLGSSDGGPQPQPTPTGPMGLQTWVGAQGGRRRHRVAPGLAPMSRASIPATRPQSPSKSARCPLLPSHHPAPAQPIVWSHLSFLTPQLWLPGELSQERLEGVGVGFPGEGGEVAREAGREEGPLPSRHSLPYLVAVWGTCTALPTPNPKPRAPSRRCGEAAFRGERTEGHVLLGKSGSGGRGVC